MTTATLTTVQAGQWTSGSTWDSGVKPADGDTVVLKHLVTVTDTVSVSLARISFLAGGGIRYDPSLVASNQNVATITTDEVYCANPTALGSIRTDGIKINAPPGIYGRVAPSGDLPYYYDFIQDDDIIFSDPGYISAGSTLQDIKAEGCARAYSRKVSNNVRYAQVTVRVRTSRLQRAAMLLRWCEGPYPVLLVTDTYMMKGFVETVATDASSVGREFITYKVTVAEAE